MKPNYQNVTTHGELCKATGQSIVECRLAGAEIASVLVCEPRVALAQAACDNGEVRYGGKLSLLFVYEDVHGNLCRAERGAEFFHKAEHPSIAPAFTAVGGLTVQSTKVRREGGQIVVSCIVEGAFFIYGEKRHTYLAGGEGLLVQQAEQSFVSRYVALANVEDEDAFECDFVKDILLHTESVCVNSVRSGVGAVDVEGELCAHFCALNGEGKPCAYERLIPFKTQVLIDNAIPETVATAKVSVLSAQVSADADEERGKSKIVLSYQLSIGVSVDEKMGVAVCTDAYSTTVETELKYEKVAGRCALNDKIVVERVHGAPLFAHAIGEGESVLAIVCPKGSASVEKSGHGWDVQGLVEGKALISKGDSVQCVDVSLPFLFPVDIAGAECDVECSVYGFGIRMRAGGEMEGECTVKLRLSACEETCACYLAEVAEGEKKEGKTCAVSVYVPTVGDDLWTTAKRLNVSPDGLRAANPALNFPLKGDERLFVYRQKKENLQK